MIINKTNIKTLLKITNTNYDNQIDILIPLLLDSIVNYCKNEFIKKTALNGYLYDSCDLIIEETTITYDTNDTDLIFSEGDFIRLYGTNYNDSMYQIDSIQSGVITINTAKSLKNETISAYLGLCDIPSLFLNVIAQYIKNDIVNDNSNVKKEQVDDTSIEFFAQYDTTRFVSSNKYILNNYKKVFLQKMIELA